MNNEYAPVRDQVVHINLGFLETDTQLNSLDLAFIETIIKKTSYAATAKSIGSAIREQSEKPQ